MYKSLQAGRAIAALMVMLFHLGKAIADDKYFGLVQFAQPFAFAGAAGVDFFFVLSGFIIFYVHQADISQPGRLRNYLWKRVARIYPTYLIIFFGVYLLALALPSTRGAVPHDLWLILQAALLVPLDVNVVGGTGAPVIIAAWSLQYEMLFYALFALAIVDRRLGIAAIALVLLITAMGIFEDKLGFPLSFIARDVVPLFLMGMVAAWVCRNVDLDRQTAALSVIVGTTIFVYVALEFNQGHTTFSGWYNTLWGIASCLIVVGMVNLENFGMTILGNRLFQLIGAASYALYLLHYPMISVLCKLAMLLELPSYGMYGAVLAYAAITLICILASIIFYRWIEQPIARLLSRK